MTALVSQHSQHRIRAVIAVMLLMIGAVLASDGYAQTPSESASVRFATGDFQDIRGAESFARLSCIMRDIERDFTVNNMSWRRARQELHQGRFDALFPVMQFASQSVGELSVPIYLEKWHYYWPEKHEYRDPVKNNLKIAVIAGSLQEVWLRSVGHNELVLANNTVQLLKLLESKRVAYILLSENELSAAVSQEPTKQLVLAQKFFRYVPVAVAFNRQFLKKNPEFLGLFNSHVNDCYLKRFEMQPESRERVYQLLSSHFERWKNIPFIESLLIDSAARHAELTSSELELIEGVWAADYLKGSYAEQHARLNSVISTKLLQARQNAQGVLNAIWFLDAEGKLYASSDPFPKFDYSSSPMFEQVKLLKDGEYYLGEIMFSPTFRRPQVILAVPLIGESNRFLGAMGFAVDVELGLNPL